MLKRLFKQPVKDSSAYGEAAERIRTAVEELNLAVSDGEAIGLSIKLRTKWDSVDCPIKYIDISRHKTEVF